MDVYFRRTGERRYAVIVHVAGRAPQVMDPAPGFDPHIPHDLVHYVVEAELGFGSGVFGRAASGGGTFISAPQGQSAREWARARRRQQRREASLKLADEKQRNDLESSERLAGICDLLWRRRQGQRPDPARLEPRWELSETDARQVDRVVARLEELAPLWNRLQVGEELVFTWPSLVPRAEPSSEAAASM